MKLNDIALFLHAVMATTRVTDARFLDYPPIAAAMVPKDGSPLLGTEQEGKGAGNSIPKPKPEWGTKPGYVSVGVADAPDGMIVRLSVDNPISGYGETREGDTLVLGPIPRATRRTTPTCAS